MGANGTHSVEGTSGTCKKIGGSRGGFGKDLIPMENVFHVLKSASAFAGYSGLFTERKLEWRIYARDIQEIVVKINNLGFR